MGIIDYLFGERKRIRDPAALADFIDEQSAFLAQKGIYEYSRARAGPLANSMMTEQGFVVAVEKSRWQGYPLALSMVGELTEGMLRPQARDHLADLQHNLSTLVLSVFDRYAIPAPIGAEAWSEARSEVESWLRTTAALRPRAAPDIQMPFAERYMAVMPIHERLRGQDFPTLQNYLKFTLCQIHDQFAAQADFPALVAELTRDAQ
jgi:hypothetical protein